MVGVVVAVVPVVPVHYVVQEKVKGQREERGALWAQRSLQRALLPQQACRMGSLGLDYARLVQRSASRPLLWAAAVLQLPRSVWLSWSVCWQLRRRHRAAVGQAEILLLLLPPLQLHGGQQQLVTLL